MEKVLQASSKFSSKMESRQEARTAIGLLLAEQGSAFYTLYLLSLPMTRPEFPSTPINAATKSDAVPVEQNPFMQPTLEGMEMEQTPELELGNCIITTAIRFRKRVKGNEWHCSIQVVPDLLHPEQEGDFEAHAFNNYADMAQRCRLRPWDRAVMRGTLQPQTIELENGQTTCINHFYVSGIEVVSRSKRTSMTAYEKGKR